MSDDKEIKVICPNCGEEIYHLIECLPGHDFIVSLEGEGLKRESIDLNADDDWIEYRCPKCKDVIENTEEEAKYFLSGKYDGH
jgi:predicted RNA-binding Zn-ribbon protein involved in translation (DUF1610 family)